MICTHSNDYSTIINKNIIKPVNNKIYWHLENFTEDMPKYKTILAFTQAFQEWQVHFNPIQFIPTDNKELAHIVIKFANNTQNIPKKFSKHTLAYAFAPFDDELGSTMWINEDMQWSEMSKPSHYILKNVILHELGHCFNLGHTDYPNDIMLGEYNENNDITIDSITGIRNLYSKYLLPIVSYKKMIKEIFPTPKHMSKLYKSSLMRILNLLEIRIKTNYKKNILNKIINEIYN